MIFPERTRVIYERNPLIEVIFQIKFERVVEIDSGNANSLVTGLKEIFPIVDEKELTRVSLVRANPDSEELVSQKEIGKEILFLNNEKTWRFTLGAEFLSLTTTEYVSWDEFRDFINSGLAVLFNSGIQISTTRVGLRYRNVIDRDDFESTDASWDQLLSPQLHATFLNRFSERLLGTKEISLLDISDDSVLRFEHGLVKHVQTHAQAYLIDADFSREKDLDDKGRDWILGKLDEFNAESGRLFRWCISDVLHEALRPRPA